MNDDEYVNLSDLTANYVDKPHEECPGEPVYQIQPTSNKAVIMEVGAFSKASDVIINQFDLSFRETCIISSSIHQLKDLVQLEGDCKFPLVKILVNYNDGTKLQPIGSVIAFFHTFKHLKAQRSISEYLSSKNHQVWLDGMFSISFHFDNKKVMLENMKEFPGMGPLIDRMIMYLATDEIRNIVAGLIGNV